MVDSHVSIALSRLKTQVMLCLVLGQLFTSQGQSSKPIFEVVSVKHVASGLAELPGAAEGSKPVHSGGPANYKHTASTMAEFAAYLSTETDRPVLDWTGTNGRYVFDLDWRYALQEHDRVDGPYGKVVPPAVIFDAVKAAGLKLTPRKARISKLIVDHVDKTPTAG
jgi:uncharacterized protein (TIGR03435 family)